MCILSIKEVVSFYENIISTQAEASACCRPGFLYLFYSKAHLFVFVTGWGRTDSPLILANLYSILINKRLLCVTKSNISICYRWEGVSPMCPQPYVPTFLRIFFSLTILKIVPYVPTELCSQIYFEKGVPMFPQSCVPTFLDFSENYTLLSHIPCTPPPSLIP